MCVFFYCYLLKYIYIYSNRTTTGRRHLSFLRRVKKQERRKEKRISCRLAICPPLVSAIMLNRVFFRIVTNHGRQLSTAAAANPKTSSKTRTAQLKEMLRSPNLEFIMEAHSALSAKIVEETGFKVSCNARIVVQAETETLFFSIGKVNIALSFSFLRPDM